MKKYQLINFFPEWQGLHYHKLQIKKKTGMALIYDWVLAFMFWEIRKWYRANKEQELDVKI